MKIARAIGLMILLFVLGCNDSQLNDKARRDNLLMPKAGSKAHSEWIANYGDTADSWALFTVSFHTRYLAQLNSRVAVLEQRLASYPDPNEIVVVSMLDSDGSVNETKKHWTEYEITLTNDDVIIGPNAAATEPN